MYDKRKRPTKTTNRVRKTRTKKTGKKIVRSNFSATPTTVTFMSNQNNPFPRRYRCKMVSSLYGFIATGVADGSYYVQLNSTYLPWALGGWPNSSSSLSSATPVGYDSLINSYLYNSVRVYGSRINVEFLPQALTDTVICTVTPSNSTAVPANVDEAMGQPYNKQLMMSSSKMNSPKGSSISNYISQSKFLGVSPRALEDDLSGNYIHNYNSDPLKPFYWIVNWTTPDAAVIATPLEYRVKVTWYIECFNETGANLLDGD